MDIKVDAKTVVVFDLDDTLYNEVDFLKSAFLYIAKTLEPTNWKQLYVQMFSLFRCKEDVFDVIAPKYGIPKTRLIAMYRDHQPNIKLFAGVVDIIDKIKIKKGKIGIITDGRKITQFNKIQSLGLEKVIDRIVISEVIGSEKPNEKNYLVFETAYSSYSYYYIADNLKKDFITPNRLGWKTIGIVDNGLNMHYESHKYLDKKHRPQEFISGILELKIN